MIFFLVYPDQKTATLVLVSEPIAYMWFYMRIYTKYEVTRRRIPALNNWKYLLFDAVAKRRKGGGGDVESTLLTAINLEELYGLPWLIMPTANFLNDNFSI